MSDLTTTTTDTTGEALVKYLARVEAAGELAPTTVEELRRFLPAVVSQPTESGWCLSDIPYAEVRPSHLVAALDAFKARPGIGRKGRRLPSGEQELIRKLPAQATVKNATAYLRMFFSDRERAYGLDRANPMTALRTRDIVGRKRGPVRERVYLTDSQVDALIAAVRPHYRRIVTVLAHSGARSGEIRGLAWGDVGEDGFTITEQATRDGKSRRQLKTYSSRRFVAFTDTTRQVFAEQREWLIDSYGPEAVAPDRLVFATRSGTAISATNLWKRIKEGAERAGLPKCGTHDLRHSAAKRLERSGVPLSAVSGILGHASVTTTTEFYSDNNVTDEEKIAAMRRAFDREEA